MLFFPWKPYQNSENNAKRSFHPVWPQVHKRIQSRDPSLVHSQDDTGFCLYPGGSSGSGLSFSAFAGGGEEQVGQSGRSVSTSCYAFKPLEAPNGSVKVVCHHRRGVDSEVRFLFPLTGSMI